MQVWTASCNHTAWSRPGWTQLFHQCISDLSGEPFLHLRPAGKAFHQSGKLAQPNDFSRRQVSHMRPPGERQQVVLAEGIELDIAKENDLVVWLMKDGGEMFARIDSAAPTPLNSA